MFKTDEIQAAFAKQIGVKINNETARQQTPAPTPVDVDRANALGDHILEIIFRGAENDTETTTAPETGNTRTAETTNFKTKTRPTYHISRIQPR